MFKDIKMWKKRHSIECFGVLLGLCLVLIIVDFFSIKFKAMDEDADFLTENSVYVSQFTTSLSGVQGNIAAFYRNEDNTKIAIVLKMSDMTYMSIDAMDYQMYVKGYNVSQGKYATSTYNKPSGGYYVFGSTGYSMIYLTDAAGFQNQAVEIIVRNNNVLTTVEGNVDADALKQQDASYAKHDQFRIIVNPAGKTSTQVDFLDDLDIVKLYQHTVLVSQEKQLRDTLKADVKQLNNLVAQINAYKKNLVAAGVSVPELPEGIAGDTFENLDDEQNTLVYKPKHIYGGGVDFDWYTSTLIEGSRFLPELQGAKSSSVFLDGLKLQMVGAEPLNNSIWYKTDGTRIDINTPSTRQDINDIIKYVGLYTTAVNQYISLKYQYQTVDLYQYLMMEYNLDSTSKAFTSNYGENAVIVW